ncbi:MAG: hypothetical protein ACR2PS_09340 [Pseudomonadales bacterium]
MVSQPQGNVIPEIQYFDRDELRAPAKIPDDALPSPLPKRAFSPKKHFSLCGAVLLEVFSQQAISSRGALVGLSVIVMPCGPIGIAVPDRWESWR